MWGLLAALVKDHVGAAVLVLLSGYIILSHSYSVFAQNAEMRELTRQIQSVQQTVNVRYIEGQLHDVEAELYALQRLEARADATEQDLRRIDKLKIRRSDLQRQLQRAVAS